MRTDPGSRSALAVAMAALTIVTLINGEWIEWLTGRTRMRLRRP